MADLNLLDIAPHQVSRDMRGYSVFFYGEPKSGKTTIASRFPNHLILAFEKGYSAIPGAMAQPVNSWGEFKKLLRQLKDPQVKEKFETIIVDTVDIAWDYVEKYICANNNVDALTDVPWGKGFKFAAKEFDESLRMIVQLGYGLVLISHAEDKSFTDESGKEYNQIVPTLDKRPRNIVSRLCDIIGYARSVQDEAGNLSTKLFLRGTPRFMAGSRFKYIPDFIEFSYDNLVGAIGDAIDREMEEVGEAFFTDTRENLYRDSSKDLDYDELVKSFDDLVTKIRTEVAESDEEFGKNWAPKIVHITETYLGKGKKVAESTREQTEAIDLIVTAMRDLIKK